jgi:hypothetical protein
MPETFHSDGREGQSMKDEPVTPLGIPYAALNPVLTSYLHASSKLFFKDIDSDLIRSWPLIKVDSTALKLKLHDQMSRQIGSGRRWDRAMNDAASIRQMYMRKVWIVENWISFRLIEDEITDHHLSEIGLAYLTDETASEVIAHSFPECEDFTKKEFENFRKLYGLVQVPQAYRRSGMMLNGVLRIIRIGGKRV